MEWSLWVAIFYGVVDDVVDGIGDVHLVGDDVCVCGFVVYVYVSLCVFHSQLEGMCHVVDYFGYVSVFFLKHSVFSVEHRHLQDGVYQQSQSTCFFVDDVAQVLCHFFVFAHCAVIEHLCCQRYA